MTRLVVLWFGALLAPMSVVRAEWIWWEAEDFKAGSFKKPEAHEFKPEDDTQARVLSEGAWVGVSGTFSEAPFLEYDVVVGSTNTFAFYARKFWQHGPFRWQFNGGPWQQIGRETALLDDAPLRKFVVANWVKAGEIALEPGTNSLRIEVTADEGAAAFDAFLLTTEPFVPRGRMKPGEKYNRTMPGWFAFEPDPDLFETSPIDWRSLNEAEAGANGFIQTKGETFVHEKTGEPIRFWGVNIGPGVWKADNRSIDRMARWFAKMGVNCVRLHGSLYKGSGPDAGALDPSLVERVQYCVSSLKKEGIYTCLSHYFPLWITFGPDGPFKGYEGKDHPFALLFFNKAFQEMYQGWWRALLTSENPYTGIPLINDPAVAMLEVINEDSYFFWTFTDERVPLEQRKILQTAFHAWLKNKYGSMKRAQEAWDSKPLAEDAPDEGRMALVPLPRMFNERDRRAQDTAAFLTEEQTAFFEKMHAFFKKTLGFRGSVYGSNWTTANGQYLGPLDKYSNTVCDFMDRHGYFGGEHKGEGSMAHHSIHQGDQYADRTALRFNAKDEVVWTPVMDLRYNNLPSIISEVNWTPPNRFRTELPVLAASYGALQGTDGFFFFASGLGWQQTLTKFSINNPAFMGQFPALSFAFRKGLLKSGEVVVDAPLKVEDIKALKGAPVSAAQNLDGLRAADVPAGGVFETKNPTMDPMAYFVGKVGVRFVEEEEPARLMELSQYVNRKEGTVNSSTGELGLNWRTGLVRIDAPQIQGAAGFLKKAGPVKLGDVSIKSDMDYGSVIVVALDGQPLEKSERMLIQAMSEDTNYGWDAPGDGVRPIKSMGAAPMVVRNISGTVTLAERDVTNLKVTPLDFNGYPGESVPLAGPVTLATNVLYYLVDR